MGLRDHPSKPRPRGKNKTICHHKKFRMLEEEPGGDFESQTICANSGRGGGIGRMGGKCPIRKRALSKRHHAREFQKKDTDLPDCFAQAKAAGFEGVELALGGQVDLKTPDDDLKRVRESAAKNGITIINVWVSASLEDAVE